MNARLLLDDELRQRVARLSAPEIRILVEKLERDASALRMFLRAVDLNKKAPLGFRLDKRLLQRHFLN